MPAKKTVILSFSLFLAGFSYHLLRGQSAPAADGIYSVDQAHRGDALYQKQCVSCHGSALDGVGPYPPLSGDDFLTKYEGQPALNVYDMIQKMMPADKPGTLSRPEAPTFLLIFSASTNFQPGRLICRATRTA